MPTHTASKSKICLTPFIFSTLSQIRYGLLFQVFALGNKTYEHYNAMGKYVDRRLEELGGVRVYELGLGDDDGK